MDGTPSIAKISEHQRVPLREARRAGPPQAAAPPPFQGGEGGRRPPTGG